MVSSSFILFLLLPEWSLVVLSGLFYYKIFCFYVGFLFVAIFPFGTGNKHDKESIASCKECFGEDNQREFEDFLLWFSYPLDYANYILSFFVFYLLLYF